VVGQRQVDFADHRRIQSGIADADNRLEAVATAAKLAFLLFR